MLPRNRVYGLSGQGRAAWARVYSRTYGLAAAARDERQGRSAGRRNTERRRQVNGRAGERASGQVISWAAIATAV